MGSGETGAGLFEEEDRTRREREADGVKGREGMPIESEVACEPVRSRSPSGSRSGRPRSPWPRLVELATVTAFGKRAAVAHQLTVCLTSFFLDEGTQKAGELGDYLKTHGTMVGPLHGLPISIKVCICYETLFLVSTSSHS